MVIKHKIKMDFTKPGLLPRVDVVQGDQYARKLEIALYAGGEAWPVPEGAAVVIRFARSDGSGGTYGHLPDGPAWSASENVLTLELAPVMLLKSGPVMLAVDVLKGAKKVSTFGLLLYVQPNVAFEEDLLQSTTRMAAYLPVPEGAEVGQFLKVAEVSEQGVVTRLEAETVASGSYPPYWHKSVREVIDKVTDAQDRGGRNCFSFAWFSDSHVAQNTRMPNPGHVGNLACAVMDSCHIPYAIMCGDAARSDGNALTSETQIRQSLEAADQVFAPIGWDRLLQVQGNHDGSWGYNSTLADPYYCFQMDARELYNAIFRKQAVDMRRIFGGDGSYYYLDDPKARVRYILLNSLWVHDGVDESGHALHRRMRTYGFGQEQLDWLIGEALHFEEEGWAVVCATHVPPVEDYETIFRDGELLKGILGAFCTHSSYSGSYGSQGEWDHVVVDCDFTATVPAELVGLFCGHAHRDRMDLTHQPFPVLTITSDADLSYDESEEKRIIGTANEHALDFVTVNRETNTVTLSRLGVGKDRMFRYGEGMNAMYGIHTSLICCTLDNGDTAVIAGNPYEAVLRAGDGCTLAGIVITMGGVDVTAQVYSEGKIRIPSVTGDVVITAVAVGPEGGTDKADSTSADWVSDSRLNSASAVVDCPGSCVTNWIDCKIGDVITVVGLDILDATSGYLVVERTDIGSEATKCSSYADHFTVENGLITYTVHSVSGSIGEYWGGRLRFSGALTAADEDKVMILVRSETSDEPESGGGENTGTNLADTSSPDWANDSRLNSSAAVTDCVGSCVTNWIECGIGDVVRISGLDILDATSGYLVVERTDIGSEATKCAAYADHFTVENGVISYTVHSIVSSIGEYWGGKLRFSGVLTAENAESVVITVAGDTEEPDTGGDDNETTGNYTNLALPADASWANDSRLNSSAAVVTCTGSCVTNWISCKKGDVIRIKGLDILDAASGYLCYYRNDTGTYESAKLISYTDHFAVSANGVIRYTVFTISESVPEIWGGQLRFSGVLKGKAADVVITLNEEI